MDAELCPEHGQNCPQAIDAADHAVRKVFAILGVDIDVPKEVEEFRDNLRFGAMMRRAVDRGMIAVVILIFTAIAAATWVGIVDKVKGLGS